MSIQAVGWAIEQKIPARPKLVLISIANHANHVDGYCWLNAETIAREAACKRRSVYNFVGALIRNGFIRKELRKGDDGKQRSTDYWILFHREEKPWHQDASLEPNEDESEPSESGTADDKPQDIVEPDAPGATGKNDLPEAPDDTRQPVEMPPGAPGPAATACHRKRFAEPSESKPKESSAAGLAPGARPRAYRPPPPQPMGAIADPEAKQIFVYEGTRAYDAWSKHMAYENGIRNWKLVTNKVVDGKWRSGWYFPSLFPPDDPKATAPPDHLTEEDVNEFLKSA